jgi:hypothetical protein
MSFDIHVKLLRGMKRGHMQINTLRESVVKWFVQRLDVTLVTICLLCCGNIVEGRFATLDYYGYENKAPTENNVAIY